MFGIKIHRTILRYFYIRSLITETIIPKLGDIQVLRALHVINSEYKFILSTQNYPKATKNYEIMQYFFFLMSKISEIYTVNHLMIYYSHQISVICRILRVNHCENCEIMQYFYFRMSKISEICTVNHLMIYFEH